MSSDDWRVIDYTTPWESLEAITNSYVREALDDLRHQLEADHELTVRDRAFVLARAEPQIRAHRRAGVERWWLEAVLDVDEAHH